MTSAGLMNAFRTRTALPHKNAKMRSVLTHVSALDLQTALQETTEGFALAYLTILETPMGSLAHQVSFQKKASGKFEPSTDFLFLLSS